jgi:protein ImuB
VQRLAELAALPRSGLARRFGAALLEELDRLHGRRPDPRLPLQLPPAFDSTLELQARADTTAQVLAGAQVLLGRLLAWAQGRQVRLCAFELHMRHDRHRGSRPPATVLRIELAEPSVDPAHLQLLLRERLGRCVLAAPTLMLALHCHEVTAGPPPNAELFPTRQGADLGLVQLLERLRARLGDAAVHRLLPLADHRPERAQCVVPARGAVQPPLTGASAAPAVAGALPAHLPLSRPAWLLAQPLPLHVAVHERLPRYRGRVLQLLSGPERIETGWWDGQPVARDYYVAADEDGTLLWIWRERLPVAGGEGGGRGTAASRPWFLHGLFA